MRLPEESRETQRNNEKRRREKSRQQTVETKGKGTVIEHSVDSPVKRQCLDEGRD